MKLGSSRYVLVRSESESGDSIAQWVKSSFDETSIVKTVINSYTAPSAGITYIDTTTTITTTTLTASTAASATATVKNGTVPVTTGSVVFTWTLNGASWQSGSIALNSSGVAVHGSTAASIKQSGTLVVKAAYTGAGTTTKYNPSSVSKTSTVAKKTVTLSTALATWTKCWDGTSTPDVRTDKLYTGQYSTSRGQNRSWIGWSPPTIPSYATNIVAKVTLDNDHWFNNSGGTLTYGIHTYTAAPGSSPALPTAKGSSTCGYNATVTFTVAGWAYNTKGIAIFAKTTSQSEYGYFNPSTAVCKLDITYQI